MGTRAIQSTRIRNKCACADAEIDRNRYRFALFAGRNVEAARARTRCLPTIDLPSGASDYLGWDAERIANTAILRKRNPGGKHEGRRIENAVFPPSLHALSPNTFPRVQDSLPDLFSLKFSSSK